MIIDGIIVALLLFAAWRGYHKGLLHSFVGLLGNIVALALAFGLSKPIGQMINQQTDVVGKIALKIQGFLPIPPELASVTASMEGVGQLYSVLEGSILPETMKHNIIQGVQDQVTTLGAGIFNTMAQLVSQVLAQYLWQGLVFLGLWIILALVITLGSRLIVGTIHHIPLLGTIDRWGGAIINSLLIGLTIGILYSAIGLIGLWQNDLIAQSTLLPLLHNTIFSFLKE